MVRIQLHLSLKQDKALKAMARARRLSRAELIRDAIDLMLAGSSSGTDALLELVGSAGKAGQSNLSEQHDSVLYSFDEPSELPLVAERRTPYRPRK